MGRIRLLESEVSLESSRPILIIWLAAAELIKQTSITGGLTLKAGNSSSCSFESPSTRVTKTSDPRIERLDILADRSFEALGIARNELLTRSIRLQDEKNKVESTVLQIGETRHEIQFIKDISLRRGKGEGR